MIDFKLDPKSGVPFYRQIIDQIRYGVAAGSLKVGEQLPTVRALAVQLKVNLNTVSKAYRELEIQKILETQHTDRHERTAMNGLETHRLNISHQ